MVVDNSKGFIKIIADKGQKITNKARTIFSDYVCLAINDTIENYEEVGHEIWGQFVEEDDNPTIDELKSRLNSVQETISDIKDNNMRLEEYILDTNYAILDMQIKLDMI